ncbi:hypothetical protein HL653_10905 [Sphingomonas sp. AP4-R1]|uniref:DUF7010 family protein n=1 Tax=Sphingomonas sp. AP4-R1 TaxID=2735134 RepID=UPI0014934ACF|nr:hypothetical protein [Sphingomonas sp. AP4-R1]QJU58230.1 hypothetical protein HL653_10905 [Sphingomonas sp. AP4-R1]
MTDQAVAGARRSMTLDEMRADFLCRRKGVPSLPITGCINYSIAALASLFVAPEHANLALAICFWAIMPVAALIGWLRGEQMRESSDNPLFRLANLARMMVLATWAIHVPVWIYAPTLFPLTIGVAFGLHWAVFSWTIDHPLGLIHLGLRCTLVVAAWLLVPGNRMGAVAAAVAVSYMISVWQLSRILRQEKISNMDRSSVIPLAE